VPESGDSRFSGTPQRNMLVQGATNALNGPSAEEEEVPHEDVDHDAAIRRREYQLPERRTATKTERAAKLDAA